jgi:integrase
VSKFTFSKSSLDRLPLPTAAECGKVGYVMHWDDRLSGFGLVDRPTGERSLVLVYRHAGRTRRLTLGRLGRITVDQARDAAKHYNGIIALGRDPAGEREAQREVKTFNEVIDLFIAEHLIGPDPQRPLRSDEAKRSCERMRKLVGSSLGRSLCNESFDDVAVRRTLNGLRRNGYNTVRSYISAVWRWGQDHGYIKKSLPNPCKPIEPLASTAQGRIVTREEYAAILGAVDAMMAERRNDPARLLAVLFVAFTGCRPVEAVRLRRECVDRKAGVARLYQHKTFRKTGKPKVFSLAGPVGEIVDRAEALHAARHDDCPFVFPRRSKQKASGWLAKTWDSIKKRAGVDIDLRQLRSGLINALDDAGLTPKEVAGVTQHMSVATVQRYYRVIEQKRALVDAGRAATLIDGFRS